MKISSIFKSGGIAIVTLMSSMAGAYETIRVVNGGAISGKITFNGEEPANPVLKITKDTDVCGSSLQADYYIVGAGNGLKNVVVAIEDINKGKAYGKNDIVAFDNKKCMFSPHVTTAVKGQKLGINNSDPVLHNTHLYHGERMRTMYNIALPLQNKVIKKRLRKAGVVTVKCDAHEWMLGYVYVAKHPYATVTATDGRFVLNDVPAGSYKVTVWHEKLGKVSKDVTVKADSTTLLNYAFSH